MYGDPSPSVYCLAKAVYHESRGESLEGQQAVANVVINRTNDPKFPNDVCSVVYQPHQFTDIKQTNPNKGSNAWKQAISVAVIALAELAPDPTKGAQYFYAHNAIKPKWASKAVQKTVIDNHTFIKLDS